MCISPITVPNPAYRNTPDVHENSMIPVPCGKCLDCLKRRTADWRFRIRQEEKRWVTPALFVTLTYDTDHVPISPNGLMTLNFRDLTLFWKRLRKSLGRQKIRYYAVGEYGTRRHRPHFHFILFGCDNISAIHDCWKLGNVFVGDTSKGSVQYVLDYVNKPRQVGFFQRDDRVRESARMSRGLGSNYMTSEMADWHLADPSRNYVVLEGGVRQALPRYFCRMLKERNEVKYLHMRHLARQNCRNAAEESHDSKITRINRYNRQQSVNVRKDL